MENEGNEIGMVKKKSHIALIIVIIILILVLGIGGWKITNTLNADKNDNTESKRKKNKSITEETVDNNVQEDSKNDSEETTDSNSIESVDVNSLTVDSSKVINPEAKGWSYSEIQSSNANMGLAANVNKRDNTGSIEIHWDKFHNFSTGYLRTNAQGGTYSDNIQTVYVKGFNGTVYSAYITGFGQSFGAETAFYIMTDGTVAYVPIQKLYNSYGSTTNPVNTSAISMSNVNGVVKIVQADAHAPYSTGSATTLGLKADGSFYDFQFCLDVNSLRA